MDNQKFENQLQSFLSKDEIPPDYVVNDTIKRVTILERKKSAKEIAIFSFLSIALFWIELIFLFNNGGLSVTTIIIYILLSSTINLVIGYAVFQNHLLHLLKGGKDT